MQIGKDVFKDTSDDFSKGGGGMSFNDSKSPGERASMVEKVFEEVLGRKPSSREAAYYKYGILKANEIRVKLLKSDEHKKILEDSSKLPNVESELKDLRISERKLVQSREDLKEEMLSSQTLLDEKNSIIKDLREQVNNPYDLPSHVQRFEEGFDSYHKERPESILEKRSLKEVLIDIVNFLFK